MVKIYNRGRIWPDFRQLPDISFLSYKSKGGVAMGAGG
jgi:hypothetical protein